MRLGARALARHAQPLGEAVDRDHPLGAEQVARSGSRTGRPARSPRPRRCRPAGCRSSRRPCSRSGRCRRGTAPARRRGRVGHLDRADVGERHAHVLAPGRRRSRRSGASSRRCPPASGPTASRPSPAFGFEFSQQREQLAARRRSSCRRRSGTARRRGRRPCRFVDAAADLDDLAHELVAEDVALLHRRDVAVVQVQVGAADRGRRDLARSRRAG